MLLCVRACVRACVCVREDALLEVCNVMSAVRGNLKMNALGKDLR